MATHSSILACRIPMDREAWRATVHGVANSWTQLSTTKQRGLHNFVNILKTSEFYSLKGWVLLYMNYISIKLSFKKRERLPVSCLACKELGSCHSILKSRKLNKMNQHLFFRSIRELGSEHKPLPAHPPSWGETGTYKELQLNQSRNMWTDASTRTPLGSEYQNTAGGASAILVQKLRFYMLKNAAKILKKDKQNTPGHWITGGSVWTNLRV